MWIRMLRIITDPGVSTRPEAIIPNLNLAYESGRVMSNADLIIEILEREGVEYLFGFPNNRLFNSAASHAIRPVIARTERVAINMADAYTRMHNGRKVGVIAVHDGPELKRVFPPLPRHMGTTHRC